MVFCKGNLLLIKFQLYILAQQNLIIQRKSDLCHAWKRTWKSKNIEMKTKFWIVSHVGFSPQCPKFFFLLCFMIKICFLAGSVEKQFKGEILYLEIRVLVNLFSGEKVLHSLGLLYGRSYLNI